MKKLLITLTLILSVAVASAQVQFETVTFSELLTKAKTENKLIFIDCYAEWCGPCKYMDSNVFPDKNVGDFMNKNFINAKINMEEGEGPAIGRKYKVRSYPTFLIINKGGDEVVRIVGSSDANEFINRIEKALKEVDNSK